MCFSVVHGVTAGGALSHLLCEKDSLFCRNRSGSQMAVKTNETTARGSILSYLKYLNLCNAVDKISKVWLFHTGCNISVLHIRNLFRFTSFYSFH